MSDKHLYKRCSCGCWQWTEHLLRYCCCRCWCRYWGRQLNVMELKRLDVVVDWSWSIMCSLCWCQFDETSPYCFGRPTCCVCPVIEVAVLLLGCCCCIVYVWQLLQCFNCWNVGTISVHNFSTRRICNHYSLLIISCTVHSDTSIQWKPEKVIHATK